MAIFKRPKNKTFTRYGAVMIGDSVDTVKELTTGYYMNEDLKKGLFTQQTISDNLDRFYSGDYGIVSAKTLAENKKSVEEDVGNITGIYPRHANANPDEIMIIHYNSEEDKIYVLDKDDFEQVRKGWADPETFEKEYMKEQNVVKGAAGKKDPEANETLRVIDPKKVYNEPGLQYNTAQREFIRQQASSYRDLQLDRETQERYRDLLGIQKERRLTKEEQKDLNNIRARIKHINQEDKDDQQVRSEIVHYYGIAHNSEIEAARHLLETGKDYRGRPVVGFDGTEMAKIKLYADKLGVKVDDILERFAEYQQVNHYNAKKAFDTVMKYLKEKDEGKHPNYLHDSIEDIDADIATLDEEYDKLVAEETLILGYDDEEFLSEADRARLAQIADRIAELNKERAYLVFQKTGKAPEEIDDEFIDDIVYAKDWPVSVADVATEIKQHFKDAGVAVKCVKDYLANNPSEKKHFKDAEIKEFDYKAFDPDIYAICYQIKDKTGKEYINEGDIAFVAYSDSDLHRKINAFLNGRKEADFEFYVKYFNAEKDTEVEDTFVKDEDFTKQTKQGYEVITIYENEDGRKYVIAKREKGPNGPNFLIGAGYTTSDGVWAQGYYNFKSEEEAAAWLKKRYEGDYGEKLKVVYHK